MSALDSTEFLRSLNQQLDELLDLDENRRNAHLTLLAQKDPARALRLRRLVSAALSTEQDDRLEDRKRRRLEAQLFADYSGTRRGPWQLDKRVAEGGMGVVYQGHRADGSFERIVAIKCLAPALLGLETVFRREIALLARLDHPSIARLLDGGTDGSGRGYLVMEWIEGRALDAFASDDAVTFEQRQLAFEALVDGVSYAHEHLVVHRDLKPANIRFGSEGNPKLLDFGIAVVLDEQDDRSGMLVALTPGWAAPEQIAGTSITTRTDVHALGRLLALIMGASATAPQRISPAQLTRVPKGLRSSYAAIIHRATQELPANRYPDAAALRTDLLRLRQNRPVSAMGESWQYVFRCFVRRHQWVVLSASLALSGLVLATIYSINKAHQAAIALSAATLETARSDSVREFLLLSLRDAADRTGESTSLREALALATERVSDAYRSDPKQEIEVLLSLAELNNQLGDFVSAMPLIERGMSLAKAEALGLEFAELVYEFGIAAPRLGRAQEAIPLLVEAEAWWAQQPKDSTKYGRLLQLRGRIARSLGKQKEGLALTKRGYRHIIADPNLLHRERAIAEQNLGVAYLQSGAISVARSYFEQAVLQFGAAHLQDTPMALDARNNLGAVLISEGNYLEAISQLERTAAARLAKLGRSAALASCYSNLGKAQLLAGQVAAARTSFDMALPMLATYVGTESPDYAAALIGSADWAMQSGEAERAIREANEAKEIVARVLDAKHPYQAVFQAMSARTRLITEPAGAVADLRAAIAGLRSAGDSAGQQMATAAIALATNRILNPSQSHEAIELLTPVLDLPLDVLPAAHPLRIEARLIVGLFKGNRSETAASFHEMVTVLGPEHPRVGLWRERMR